MARAATTSEFGAEIANAGDVDGDGVDDLMVGEPYYSLTGNGPYEGRVYIISGATQAVIRSHSGNGGGDVLAGAGDANLDGYADYAIGSPSYSSNGHFWNGELVVYSGVDGSVLWTIEGDAWVELLGFSVAGIDDVDGDGRRDLLVGSIGNGDVKVYSADGSVLNTLTGPWGSQFGYSLAACGDLDGDGVRDYLVGAPSYSSTSPAQDYRGAVYVYSAKTATLLYVFVGDWYDGMGLTVSSLGDVNGDGVPDLLAGSSSAYGNGTYSGMIRVASGADGATIRTVYGDALNDRLGSSLVGMGDMNRDGVDDYAAATVDGP